MSYPLKLSNRENTGQSPLRIEAEVQFIFLSDDKYKVSSCVNVTMSNQSAVINQDSSSLLSESETERLSWFGVLKESDEEEYPARFVATDNRLIFSFGSGHFKDIGFNHVESVESAADNKSKTEGIDPNTIGGIGVVLAIVGIGAMFNSGFSASGMLGGLVLCGLGGVVMWYTTKNYDKMKEEMEVIEYTVYHILLQTAAESPFSRPIYIETEENVGPELSKLVQENQ